MNWNVITNLSNGVGLQRDYQIIRELLTGAGHVVRGVQFDNPGEVQPTDRNLFLETFVADLMPYGREQWVMPNPEWWFAPWSNYLKQVDRVLCKTNHALVLFSGLTDPHKCVFTGFKSRDFYDAEIKRERNFLHVAGKSQTKNTLAVLAAWKRERIPAKLTVVSEHYFAHCPSVAILDRVTDERLAELLNSHLFHVMPSGYEGFGHVIHEGLGVGAVMILTDAPPMVDWVEDPRLLVDATIGQQFHSIQMAAVTATAVERACMAALDFSAPRIRDISVGARLRFVTEDIAFQERFLKLVGQA